MSKPPKVGNLRLTVVHLYQSTHLSGLKRLAIHKVHLDKRACRLPPARGCLAMSLSGGACQRGWRRRVPGSSREPCLVQCRFPRRSQEAEKCLNRLKILNIPVTLKTCVATPWIRNFSQCPGRYLTVTHIINFDIRHQILM